MFSFFMLYHYFHAFWRLLISAWFFFLGGGVNLWSRDIFRFCWKPEEFFSVLSFGPIASSPSLEIQSTFPAPTPTPPPPPGTLVFFSVFTTECQYFCLRYLVVVRQRGRKEGRKRTNDNVFLPIEITIAFIWLSDL